VTCDVDGANSAACTTSYAYASLATGTHTFHVTALDAAGNSQTTSQQWTVDASAPTVTFTLTPASYATDATAHLTWTCSESPCTYSCSIDNGAYAACGADVLYAIGPGSHVFSVYASDRFNNSDPVHNTATYRWVNRSNDGRVVLIGNNFSTIAAPYTAVTQPFVNALGNAVLLQPYSPATGKIEVLIYQGSTPAAWINDVVAAVRSVTGVNANILVASPTDLAAALVGKQALIIADQNGIDVTGLATTWTRPLNDFVNRGGLVVAMEGLDSAGVASGTSQMLSLTGLMAVNGGTTLAGANVTYGLAAGDHPLVRTTSGPTALPNGVPTGSVYFSPIQWGASQTSTVIPDGNAALYAQFPFTNCLLLPCMSGRQAPIIQYRVVHIVESFDYVPATAWPATPWSADAAGGTFVPGRDEVAAISNTSWAQNLYPDTSQILDGVSAWIQVRTPAANAILNLGMHSNQGGVSARAIITDFNSTTAFVKLGMSSLNAAHVESNATSGGPTASLTIGQWYRLDLISSQFGGYYEARLWDANHNLLSVYDASVAASASGGVVFKVPAAFAMDTVTTFEAPATLAQLGMTNGNQWDAYCPAGMAITGFYGYSSTQIDRLGVHCGKVGLVASATAGNFDFTASAGQDLQWWAAGNVSGTAFDAACPQPNEFVSSLIVTVNANQSLGGLSFNCSKYGAFGSGGRMSVYSTGGNLYQSTIGSNVGTTTTESCVASFATNDQFMDHVSLVYGGTGITTAIAGSCRPVYNW
jgi:hypothetical protein